MKSTSSFRIVTESLRPRRDGKSRGAAAAVGPSGTVVLLHGFAGGSSRSHGSLPVRCQASDFADQTDGSCPGVETPLGTERGCGKCVEPTEDVPLPTLWARADFRIVGPTQASTQQLGPVESQDRFGAARGGGL